MPTLSVEPNERVTFRVCHEDEDLLIVEKPSGLVTQPGVGHLTDTLLNGLFAVYGTQLQNLGNARDFGLVHRLDRETSGLLAVALTRRGYDGLRAQFEKRTTRKFYWAVCKAAPSRERGVIRIPIAERVERASRYTSTKTARIGAGGKPALTAYRVLQEGRPISLIEARPVTGRLHQVRVHLDAIGATVLGDPVYGPKLARELSPRLALHAHRLCVTHPATGKPIDVRTKWPRDLRNLLRKHGLERPDLAPAPDEPEDLEVTDGPEISGDADGAQG
ncbi:MAG: RluA family pseudouridine synthase [Phycisphaerales bacterium JB037]